MEAHTSVSGRLPHIGLLRFAGADALGFLQGQVSNDTRRLGTGSPLLAAYSSPQGRVLAVLHLLPHSTGIIALLPREILLPTLERLRKFVLRAKVQIEDLSDRFCVTGQHGTQALAAGGLEIPEAGRGYAEHDGIGVGCVAANCDRFWVIGTSADLESHGMRAGDAETVRRAEHDWRLADVRAGLPQVYAATREMFVAQMLNLDLIDGISFTKGCFTGQEIIARTQHLGRIKRRLFRLRLPMGTWAIGQTLRLMDGRSGRITELAQSGEGYEALAVLGIEPGGAAGAASGGDPAGAGADAESASSMPIDAVALRLPYALA